MSKGRKPKKNNVPPITTRDEDDGDGGGVEAPEDICWDFTLIEKTAEANTVKEGTVATGSIQGKLVLVRANSKPLGYAPPDVSQLMITAARAQGARLSGSVTSPGKKGEDVWIQLCLKN